VEVCSLEVAFASATVRCGGPMAVPLAVAATRVPFGGLRDAHIVLYD
jgi:hypothetical protein